MNKIQPFMYDSFRLNNCIPNKLAACPLRLYVTVDNSFCGIGVVSGLHGETILPSLSLSSSLEKLVGNKALLE